MPKIVVLPLGLYVNTQQQRSVDAFAKLGISKLSLLWNWLPLPSFLRRFQKVNLTETFDKYRRGELTTKQFRTTANYFASPLKPKDFDNAWNAQCVVTDYSRAAFEDIEKLQAQGAIVYVFSGTNPLNVNHIEKQYGKKIPGTHFFSYQHGVLGQQLIQALCEDIKTKHPESKPQDIAWFYSHPGPGPLPGWGFMRWILAPFKMWFYQKAHHEVATLQHLGQGNKRFTLFEQFKANTKEPGIFKALKDFMKSATLSTASTQDPKVAPLTPAHQQQKRRGLLNQKQIPTSEASLRPRQNKQKK